MKNLVRQMNARICDVAQQVFDTPSGIKNVKFNRFLVLLVGLLTICVTQVWGVTFNASDFSGGTSGTGSSVTKTIDGVTVSTDKGYATTQFRVYQGGKLTISSSVGNISSIVFTFNGSYTGGLSVTYDDVNSASKEFTTSSQARITKIEVTIASAPSVAYSVTFDAGSNGTCSTSSLTEASAGAGVTLPNVTANTGFVFKGWATTSGAATANAGAAGANYKPSANCTLYAVYGSLYTVTLGDNSATLTQTTEGANVTLPSRTGNATWTFAGWSETNNATETTTAPTIIKAGDYKPTANVTLYPVYTRTEGGSGFLLSQTVSGTTYYAQAQGASAYLPATTTKASATAFYLEDNSTQKNLYWMDGATKYYVGGAGSSTSLDAKATSASHSWNVTEGTGTLTFKSGSRWLTLNTSTKDRFSTYTTEYALTVTPDGTTYYISVIGPTYYTASVAGGLVNGSINLSTSAHTLTTLEGSETITITPNPNDGYQLKSITVKKASDETVIFEFHGSSARSFTMPRYNVTVTAEFATARTITWMVDGAEAAAGSQSTSIADGARVTAIPATPANCSESRKFVGWTDHEITTPTDECPVLYRAAPEFPLVSANTTYYAVYANAGAYVAPTVLNMTDLVDRDLTTSQTLNGITLTAAQNEGGTAPSYVEKFGDMRLYAKNTIRIQSSSAMKGISFAISYQGEKKLAEITSTVEAVETGNDPSRYCRWRGSATDVTFTVGDNNVYGSESGGAGQLCFENIIVDYSDLSSANRFATICSLTKKRIYLDLSGFDSWEGSSAHFVVWDGLANQVFSKVTDCANEHLYLSDNDVDCQGTLYVKRVNPSNHGETWNEASLSLTEAQNMVHVSNWSAANGAVYTPSYTITYNMKEHGKAIDAVCCATSVAPAEPKALGYTFGGWYSDEACTSAYTFGAMTGDITVYAKWTATETKTIYLDPVAVGVNWTSDNATIFAHAYCGDGAGDRTGDYKMSRANACDNVYKIEGVPANAENILFVRCAAGRETVVWAPDADHWNETSGVAFSNTYDLYTLTGWDAAATATANFAATTFSITFNDGGADGGAAMTTVSGLACGATPNLPAMTRTKAGFAFAGWATTDGGDVVYADRAAVAALSEDITLYAKWNDNRIFITWSVNGESYTTGTPTTVLNAPGKVIVVPTAPGSALCDGEKVFMGWTDTPIDGETDSKPAMLRTSASEFTETISADKTFYAVFANSDGDRAPVFSPTCDGGDFNIAANVSGTMYYASAAINNSTAKYIGTNTDKANARVYTLAKVSDGVFTIYDKTAGKYVKYGSSSSDLQTQDAGYNWNISSASNYGTWLVEATTGTSRAMVFRESTFKRFAGYQTTNLNGTEYFNIELIGVSSASYSGYATTCEVLTKYSVTFNNGGKGTLNNTNGSYARVGLQQMTAVTGYTHTGWTANHDVKVGGETITAGSSINVDATATVLENTAFTAVWTANVHTLSWVTDGDALTGSYTSGDVAYGTDIVKPDTPTKTGYTFDAWSPSVPATMGDANATYTATWTINNYNITWMVNGASWNTGHGSPSTSADYNTAITATPTAPTTSDCDDEKVFVGWTTSQIDTETDVKPSPFYRKLSDFEAVTANTIYYAVFANRDGSGIEEKLTEDFAGITAGNSTSSSGSNTSWDDSNSNFSTRSNCFKAGGAVRLAKSGYLTTKELDLSAGVITVSFDLKGWASDEHTVSVQVDAGAAKSATCSGYLSTGDFETKTLTFPAATATSKIKFFTDANNRVFLDNIVITVGEETLTALITECVTKTPLDPATNLQVSNITSTTATLSWDAVTNASTYVVTLNGVAQPEQSTTTLNLTGLTVGTNYTWSVTAKGGSTYRDSQADVEDFRTLRMFTVRFNKNAQNGGSVSGSCPVTDCSTTVEENTEYEIPANPFTQAGYTKNGWNNSSECTETPYYTIGATITITEDVTFYANWTAKQDVYVDDMHGNTINPNDTKGRYVVPTLTTKPVTEGACETSHTEFVGWILGEIYETGTDTEPSGLVEPGSVQTASGKTYHAVWVEVE